MPSMEYLPDFEHTYFSQNRSAKKIRLDSLDPCLGLGFLLKNSSDLKAVKQAFAVGQPLSTLVTLYDKQPTLTFKTDGLLVDEGFDLEQGSMGIPTVQMSCDSNFSI